MNHVIAADDRRFAGEDDDLLSVLDDVPPSKRQPNLLFAAVRYLLGTNETPRPSAAPSSSIARRSRRSSGRSAPRRTNPAAVRPSCPCSRSFHSHSPCSR